LPSREVARAAAHRRSIRRAACRSLPVRSKNRNFNSANCQRSRLSRVDATGPTGGWGGQASSRGLFRPCTGDQRTRAARKTAPPAFSTFSPGAARRCAPTWDRLRSARRKRCATCSAPTPASARYGMAACTSPANNRGWRRRSTWRARSRAASAPRAKCLKRSASRANYQPPAPARKFSCRGEIGARRATSGRSSSTQKAEESDQPRQQPQHPRPECGDVGRSRQRYRAFHRPDVSRCAGHAREAGAALVVGES